MIFQMFVDLVNLKLLPSPEVLTADVACINLEVNLAVVIIEEVCAWEGHVASLALLLGVVIVDVVFEFAFSAKNLSARLTKFALAGLGVNSCYVTIALRFFCERSAIEMLTDVEKLIRIANFLILDFVYTLQFINVVGVLWGSFLLSL
jgi:hypothetical protein